METVQSYPYTFDPSFCKTCGGKCCRVGGYVWITAEELDSIAEFLNMDSGKFSEGYVRRIYTKLSLKERNEPGDRSCVMFDREKELCTIYPVRPNQCKTYPFWEQYKKWPKQVLDECPGVQQIK